MNLQNPNGEQQREPYAGCEPSVHWPKRVAKERLRRLYASEAAGLLDEELLDEVGITLYLRCEAILDIDRAQSQGLVRCPQCQQAGQETLIRRLHPSRQDPEPLLRCATCGWEMSWPDYQRTFRRRQLNIGGAGKFFAEFVKTYPRLEAARDKMAAVDRLIHGFHYSLRADPTLPTRPAAINLIEGRMGDIVPFLDELTYGASSPRLAETRRAWEETMDRWVQQYPTAWQSFQGHGWGRQDENSTCCEEET